MPNETSHKVRTAQVKQTNCSTYKYGSLLVSTVLHARTHKLQLCQDRNGKALPEGEEDHHLDQYELAQGVYIGQLGVRGMVHCHEAVDCIKLQQHTPV